MKGRAVIDVQHLTGKDRETYVKGSKKVYWLIGVTGFCVLSLFICCGVAIADKEYATGVSLFATAIGLLVSVVLGVFVFYWSWNSNNSSQKIFKRLDKTAHGQLRNYNHVGEHIEDFVAALTGYTNDRNDRLNAIRGADTLFVMLSTPLYGIETRDVSTNRPPHVFMNLLVDSLQEWVDICSQTHGRQKLEFSIWPLEEHKDLWGVRKGKTVKTSPWYKNKSDDALDEMLKAMVKFCKLIGSCGSASNKVDFEMTLVRKNDARIFLIDRGNQEKFSLKVLFSNFTNEEISQSDFVTTGFMSENTSAFNRMLEIRESYTRSSQNIYAEKNSETGVLLNIPQSSIKNDPFNFIAKYYGLDDNWYGFESLTELKKKACDLNTEWWKMDIECFNVSIETKRIQELNSTASA